MLSTVISHFWHRVRSNNSPFPCRWDFSPVASAWGTSFCNNYRNRRSISFVDLCDCSKISSIPRGTSKRSLAVSWWSVPLCSSYLCREIRLRWGSFRFVHRRRQIFLCISIEFSPKSDFYSFINCLCTAKFGNNRFASLRAIKDTTKKYIFE